MLLNNSNLLKPGSNPWFQNNLLCFFIAALSISLIAVLLLTDVTAAGVWDGESSVHVRMTMEIVNDFSKEWNSGGDPSKAFLHAYTRFPKQLHDIMLAVSILVLNGIEPIDFATAELYASWFSTIWTLVAAGALVILMRYFVSSPTAFIALIFVMLSGYILMYASHPRQNMPAHAMVWIATTIYIIHRSKHHKLDFRMACLLGVIFGISVPTHYSSMYWVIGLAACEFAICFYDKQWRHALLAILLVIGTALAIWCFLDLYYFIFSNLYPSEMDFRGKFFRRSDYGFFAGMFRSVDNIYINKDVWLHKMEPMHWWYLFGFIYRNNGLVGSVLISIGLIGLLYGLKQTRFHENPQFKRACIIVLVLVLLTLLMGLRPWQNARKLMPFYPAWCVLLAAGIHILLSMPGKLFQKNDHANTGTIRPLSGIVIPILICTLLLSIHAITYFEQGKSIHHAMRDGGYMRRYLETNGIHHILILPAHQETTLAPVQTPVQSLTLAQADTYDYIVLNRLYPRRHGHELIDCTRNIQPLISFNNQASLKMFWYEFPLKQDFFNQQDPMLISRNLYKWPVLRDNCLSKLLQKSYIRSAN